ncbi:hypothetical protein [Clostridium sp.]|uniref:hypothetical protein n=1 Tax=Clostridium sp. TaxID=1506 RepID=UPI001A3BD244|nr:hypothetical protein [Clostridium sp.]MBK5242554.1 hypothetical protein [Clostridium sp.]
MLPLATWVAPNINLNIKGRKRPALIVMELRNTGNGYINGRYINTNAYETTKAGDVNIKNFTNEEIIKLIEQAMHNIKKEFK